MADETGPGADIENPTEQTPTSASRDVLYLGVDLGTANSSVATSTDITRTVPSVVGWPKDLVAQSRVKRSILKIEKQLL